MKIYLFEYMAVRISLYNYEKLNSRILMCPGIFQKTPGTIDFTLHAADNLRIVSVRCEDVFSMTADLCNEEGL